ncbi:MAG: hypothetical protein K0Q70_716 [Rhodospirillales bacterium]|jgi:uncharacterized protein YdbL (DUF1318 family)|nr:hypothetical protein [Rhodospirillales bacterium]
MLRRNRFFSIFVAGLLLLTGTAAALAQSQILDGPRRAGTIGERFDGYAVVRSQAESVTLAPLVGSVNAERRKVYSERAHAENVPVDQIGRVYAAEIFRNAPAGTWFLRDDGQWTRK